MALFPAEYAVNTRTWAPPRSRTDNGARLLSLLRRSRAQNYSSYQNFAALARTVTPLSQ